ncbi:MAG: hypothetical protein IJX22_02025 [Opitutales bacterium]|nr:hypothetical protein [Opitutales bacterium]
MVSITTLRPRKITVRILRNDNDAEPLGEPVTLAPGQTLELAYVPERA